MNNNIFNQLAILGVSLSSSLFGAFFISLLINFFYMFYIQSKYSALRIKASTSFPKNHIITKEMIEAEMIKQDPNYGRAMQNFLPRFFKIFFITFLILLFLNYIGFNSANNFFK